MKKSQRFAAIITLILALVLASSIATAATPQTVEAYVIKTVDGDTFQAIIQGKKERVRMIGIDTPETHHPTKPVQPYGPEAEQFTRQQLQGQTVYLEFDVGQRDRFGRILAYIWTSQPANDSDSEIRNKMFNGRLLLDGYARLMTIPPNVRYVDHFQKYQKEARNAGNGVWE